MFCYFLEKKKERKKQSKVTIADPTLFFLFEHLALLLQFPGSGNPGRRC
jgi:hypothetical protein